MKLTRTLNFNPVWFNVIPLVNVLFLLLAFFALTSNFILQPGIAVTPPFSSFSMSPQRNPQIVSITAGTSPLIFFRDERVTVEQLRERLAGYRGEERSLIIKADRRTAYEHVVTVMNQGLQLGYSVVLATTEEAP